MTKISVSSHICGVSHNRTGKVEGDRIVIKIDTPVRNSENMHILNFLFTNCHRTRVILSRRWKDRLIIHLSAPGNVLWTAPENA
jgi:hypothetical protein